jgi:hypothetical protein
MLPISTFAGARPHSAAAAPHNLQSKSEEATAPTISGRVCQNPGGACSCVTARGSGI